MNKKNAYKNIYSRLIEMGVGITLIAARISVTRTGMRKWFEEGRLDYDKAQAISSALENYARDVIKISDELKKAFSKIGK